MDFFNKYSFDLTSYFWVLVIALGVLLVVQVLYYLLLYKKPYSYESKRSENIDGERIDYPPVSIVIASKNESENLAKNLPLILKQDYPNFEVVVVNMGSTDETDVELKRLSTIYPNLYHTFVPSDTEDYNSKKLALTLGIKAAQNDILLFTEIYCSPVSDQWISEFVNEFRKGKDIVLGYSKLEFIQRFFMRGFVTYDNLMHQVKFLSMAIWGKPFMGINRNLAYRKSLFFEEKGFSSVLTFQEGEDDLFVNRVCRNAEVGVVVAPNSMTKTDIITSFRKWMSFKERYMYNKRYYKGSSKFLFGFESLTKYLFYITSIVSIAYGIVIFSYSPLFLGLGSLFIRFMITRHVISRLYMMFKGGSIHINLIIYELFQPISNLKLRRRAKKKRYVR